MGEQKGASTMPHEVLEGVLSAIQAIEKFASRLPEGDVSCRVGLAPDWPHTKRE
jgi:hypothetical protein